MINISRIDLNLFVVFDAIYTEGGITRASDMLKLSQPATSHALRRLRELIGDPLFIRQGNAITPTPLAHELIGPVRRALGEIEGSLNQLSTFDPATSEREFKIGMRQVVESAAIPELINEINDTAPLVKISSVYHNRASFQTELSTGTLAAAIDVLQPRDHGIRHKQLAGGKMVVVARKGHPVVQGRISMASYLEQDHILASSRRLGPGIEDYELSRLGFQRRIKLRCQHYWTACKVANQSDMLVTMPERYACATNDPLENQIVPFPIDIPAHDIFLYWHSSADNDHANRWLREQILVSFQRI